MTDTRSEPEWVPLVKRAVTVAEQATAERKKAGRPPLRVCIKPSGPTQLDRIEQMMAAQPGRDALVENGKKGGKPKSMECREYGCLTVYGDFLSIVYAKTPFNLKEADIARALFCYLCNENAVGRKNARTKQQIVDGIKSRIPSWGPIEFRPSAYLREKLAGLLEALGKIDSKGLYWIKD